MRPLRYSINVTLDGCCDHAAVPVDVTQESLEAVHRHAVENLQRADALLFGRVTYQMMEEAWRAPAQTGSGEQPGSGEPGPGDQWTDPFARTIDAARKHVVSSTLTSVDWNAELVRGDLGDAVRALKEQPGKGLLTGGLQLPKALAELGLIDEYELVVHPRVAGRGPTLFAGLSTPLDLRLVDRIELANGAVAERYVPRT